MSTAPKSFITKASVKMTALPMFENPNAKDWPAGASHWQVKLERYAEDGKRRTFVTSFSQGAAHKGPPKVESVIGCLASDCQSMLSAGGFDDWASDLGYAPDSRSALLTYETIRKQAADLLQFFGADLYSEFLTVEY